MGCRLLCSLDRVCNQAFDFQDDFFVHVRKLLNLDLLVLRYQSLSSMPPVDFRQAIKSRS